MKKYIFTFFLCAFVLSQDVISGYLRGTEVSFCMDECGRYYIESEIDSGFGLLPVVFNDDIEVDFYLNRFVEVRVSDEEIDCIECSALQVLELNLSDDCDYPVDCFTDPCTVADECQLNTPVDCISNYCGGCYADFYDLDNNLVDCYDGNISKTNLTLSLSTRFWYSFLKIEFLSSPNSLAFCKKYDLTTRPLIASLRSDFDSILPN